MAYPISDVPRRIVYSGSAGVGPYAFTFEVLANTDIAVYKNTTLLTLTTDYTVSINSGTGTGTVTLVVAATGSDTVTIVGDRAIQRTSDFVTGGDLFANTLNDELDAQTIYVQQVDEKADRSLRAPVTDPTTINMVLPAQASRANSYLTFDANGNPTTTAVGAPGSPSAITRQTFSGNGSSTVFTLAAAPGASGNSIQVYIGGVYQQRSTYTIVGTTLTFSEAPVAGTNNIEVVNFSVTAVGQTDASLVTYIPAGTGAASRTIESKLRDAVSVLDFGADPTGASDSTTAFTNAQAASDSIYIPPGTYLLDEFKQQNRKVFTGGGLNNTFIKQANASRPAWWCVSKTGTYETQILGAGLSGVWFLGASGSTVASMIVEAATPYVVAYSNFDIGGSGGFHTLEVKTTTQFEVYSSVFKVYQDNPDSRGGSSVGSTDTGVLCGAGVYNEWYLNIAKAANGKAFTSSDWGAVFHHAVSEGSQTYSGQHNTIIAPTIEAWYGSADGNGAMQILGANNRVIGATLTNVPSAKCADIGIALNAGGGVNTTILGYSIYGTYPLTAPIYPINIPSGNTGTFTDFRTGGAQYKVDQYVSDAILKNFSFVGDVSQFTTKYAQASCYFETFTPTLQFGGASTGITYALQDASFQRVGKVVNFTISINLTAKGSSTGSATIAGLPIAGRTSAFTNQPLVIFTENVTIPAGYVVAYINSGSSAVTLAYAVSASGSGGLTDVQFANNSIVRVSGSYLID